MQLTDPQLAAIMDSLWTSVLGFSLDRAPVQEELEGPFLTGCVHFTGSWAGALTIASPEPFVRKAAAIMFGMEPSDVAPQEMYDALGELANVAGGNFKTALPRACVLSLPTVVQGVRHKFVVPSSHVVVSVAYQAEGGLLVVKVLERDAG